MQIVFIFRGLSLQGREFRPLAGAAPHGLVHELIRGAAVRDVG